MKLENLQRELLHLIREDSTAGEAAAPYILEVAGSPQLQLVRSIALWWRVFGIERGCPLTSTLLKRRGTLEDTIQDYLRRTDPSPYMEQLGLAFVTEMAAHSDSLVASVAGFERAMLRTKQGDATEFHIIWDYEPYTILGRLLQDSLLNEEEVAGRFRTIVASNLPGLFEVVEEDRFQRSTATTAQRDVSVRPEGAALGTKRKII